VVEVATLAGLGFFSHVHSAVLSEVAQVAVERAFDPGQVLLWEGEPATVVHFPLEGVLRARRVSAEGREQVLGHYGPDSCLDLAAALDGGVNVATVDAVGPVVVCSLPAAELRRLIGEHASLARAASCYLAAEVRRLSIMVEALALHTVRARLARFLLDAAEGRGVQRRWTQEEIATQIGTVREVVGRTLHAFMEEGWIRRRRGRLVVTDADALQREAAGSG